MKNKDELRFAFKNEVMNLKNRDETWDLAFAVKDANLAMLSIATCGQMLDELMESTAGLAAICQEYAKFVEKRTAELGVFDDGGRVLAQKAMAISYAAEAIAERTDAAWSVLTESAGIQDEDEGHENLVNILEKVGFHRHIGNTGSVEKGIDMLREILEKKLGVTAKDMVAEEAPE